MKTVCFFGIYDPEYSRNRVLGRGFRENGWKVVECRIDPKAHRGLYKYWLLAVKWRRLKIRPDILLVAYPGQTVVWLARLLFRGRLVFDSFLSLYDSNVFDRKVYGRHSIRAGIDWLLDKMSCAWADDILLDTEQHISYFTKTFGVPRRKMIRVPIGADDQIFKPPASGPADDKAEGDKFLVHFHGMFIPLQGVSYILDAAEILASENIKFTMVGSGQQFEEMKNIAAAKKLNNVEFAGKQPLEKLPRYIEQSDVCLGIFGDTDKTDRVIPNKVYEYIAMKRPVITAETPAIREFFTNNIDMLMCKRADGASIAQAIRIIMDGKARANSVARAGYERFNELFRPKAIVTDLLYKLHEEIKNK